MAKVTFSFVLPEEQYEYKQTVNAADMSYLISSFTMFLRDKVKYGNENNTTWEAVKEEWWKLLAEAKIDPYED